MARVLSNNGISSTRRLFRLEPLRLCSYTRSSTLTTYPTAPLRRTFFNLGGSVASAPPLTIHTSRELPYGRAALFSLISDVGSYPSFIPFCTGATVHAFSRPDARTGRRWPAGASLRVGFSGYSESYVSRVYCEPFVSVEAVSGDDADGSAAVSRPGLEHYRGVDITGGDDAAGGEGGAATTELFSSLRAKWSLEDAGAKQDGKPESTRVSLAIEARWKNPLLAAVSREVAPGVASKIIEAFEKRAREKLG